MMTKDGKIFGKINAFDFIVAILIVVMVVIMINNKLVVNKKAALEKNLNSVDISYKLIIRNIRDVTINTFEENKPVFDYNLGNSIGIITQVKFQQAKSIMKLLDGKIINAPIEDKYDMTISVEAKAVKNSDNTFTIGQTKIIDGQEIKASTQKGNCIATIKEIN